MNGRIHFINIKQLGTVSGSLRIAAFTQSADSATARNVTVNLPPPPVTTPAKIADHPI